jgi:uncharacterized phage-associated protein
MFVPMSEPPFDPRAIGNLLLEEAEGAGCAMTNLALQKLLYFTHAICLIDRKRPLVSGYFEAWKYGPVHPTVYRAFKSAGAKPISFRATRQNLITGEQFAIDPPSDQYVRHLTNRVINSYGKLTPGQLVNISHAKRAPWEFIVDKGRRSVTFGLRIPDEVILDRFRFHTVAVSSGTECGVVSEDTPFT